MKPTLVILYAQQRLAAWYLAAAQAPARLRIQGQDQLDAATAQTLVSAYADLAARLQDHCVQQIHWLLDPPSRAVWAQSLPMLETFPGTPDWQMLSWPIQAERLGWGQTAPWGLLELIESELLPQLAASSGAAEQLIIEHHSQSERLAAERAALQLENQRLSAQNAALRQVDAERLASYLPALFARVFTVLGAADLALLCGRLEPLNLPNPYPEPSAETLHTLQKNFRALPLALQRQIVGSVSLLPQRRQLQARPEMRDLIHELERANHG